MRTNSQFLIMLLLSMLVSTSKLAGQNIEYIKVPELTKILNNPDNKLFVINFWATWCQPCIIELPHFEKVAKDYESTKVKFILVSLDFPSQIKSRLIPFLKKNKVTLDVAVMTDVDYNSWIDLVDPLWQGNIPATLFLNNATKKRYFHMGTADEPGLKKYINSFL